MTTKEGNTLLRKSVGLSENINRTWQQNKFLENAALMGNLAKKIKSKKTKKTRKSKSKSDLQPEFSDIERKILEKITAKQKTQSPKTLKKSSSPRWGMKEKQAEFRRYVEKRLTDKLHNLAASIGWPIPENMSFPKKLELYKLLSDKPDVIYNLPEYSPTSPVDTNFTTYDDKIEFTKGRVGNKSKKRKKKKYKKRKSSKKKKKKKKTRKKKKRNVFGRGSAHKTESWYDLEDAIKNSRTEYITRQWIDLADPTAYRKPGCESYYDKNRVYKVEISCDLIGELRFKFIKNFIGPEMANTCKLSEDQILNQDEYEFATKTGKYEGATYNQFMTIKKERGYDMSEH